MSQLRLLVCVKKIIQLSFYATRMQIASFFCARARNNPKKLRVSSRPVDRYTRHNLHAISRARVQGNLITSCKSRRRSFANSILSNFRLVDVCVPLLSRAHLCIPMHAMHPTSESNSALIRVALLTIRLKKVRANLRGNEDRSIFMGNRASWKMYILQYYTLKNVA